MLVVHVHTQVSLVSRKWMLRGRCCWRGGYIKRRP